MFMKQLMNDVLKLAAVMTIVTAAVLISVFGSVAKADSAAQAQAGAQAGSIAGAQSGAQSGSAAYTGASGAQSSQTLGIDQRNYSSVNNPPADLSRGVGSSFAPAIYNSMITCMGGVSAAGGFAGGSFGLGASIESGPCNIRQFAILVQNNPALFKAVMCQDDTMQEAYAKVGESCDSPAPKLTAAQAQAISDAKMEALKANAVANLNLATTNNDLNSRVVAKPKADTSSW